MSLTGGNEAFTRPRCLLVPSGSFATVSCFKSGIDLVDGINTRSMYEGQESTSSHWRRYKLWGMAERKGTA